MRGIIITGVMAAAFFATTIAQADDRGKAVYTQNCVVCHGANGKGAMPGTPDFTKADGVLSKPDNVLINNIINGVRRPGAPMGMPAKGGNPQLTRADIEAVVRYLHQAFGGKS